MTENPRAFGWTQILSIAQLFAAVTIAIFGFRTFHKWRKEQVEQRKIDAAVQALALAYESKSVFQYIRSPLSYSSEWKDMPIVGGETQKEREIRGKYYVFIRRINDVRDYFDRLNKSLPNCMALFGSDMEKTFEKIFEARKNIFIAVDMLTRHDIDLSHGLRESEHDQDLWDELRAHLWSAYKKRSKKGDEVGRLVGEFVLEIENVMKPVIRIRG